MGRARRRRDHVERAADRHRADHEARAGRRDHHPVRLPDVRGARAGQDGLPRPAQPHASSTTRSSTSRPTAARRSSWRSSASTTARPTSCWPAATPSASSSSTVGPMRSLLRSMQPDKFEDISAVSALYRPGPMGADSHNKYARRKNGSEPIDPIHPELAEALEPVLGETYGLIVYQEQVMEIAQVLAGFSLGQADNLRRAMGKKKKAELDKQYAGFQAGMLERGFPQARSTSCGRSCSRSPTTPSTRRTPRRTASSPTGRPTSRPTTRPSTWRPCSRPSRTTRTSRRSTSTSAAGWASRCSRPTSTSRSPTSRRSATTSASASPRSATSATTSSPASWPPARRRAATPTSTTSWTRSPPSSATSGCWSR